jgi:outer membrane protein assembly factor BamB
VNVKKRAAGEHVVARVNPEAHFVLCGLLALLLPCIPAPAGEAVHEWPMSAGDAAWTGSSPDERLRPPLRLRWTHQTDGTIRVVPIVAGGKVLVSLQQGTLLCLDAETGGELWQRQMGSRTSNVSCDGRRVFVARGGVIALDAKTGKDLWRAGSPVVYGWRAAPVFGGDRVYWSMREDGSTFVAAFNVEDGKPAWKAKVGGPKCYTCAPSVGGGRVLVTTKVGKEPDATVALDEKTGEELWRVKGLVAKRAVSIDGKHAYVADTVPGVTALDVKTGARVWHWGGAAKARKPFYTREITSHNPPVVANGRLFVKAYFGFFNALDPEKGTAAWSFDDGAGTGCAMPSAAPGYLFFATGNYSARTGGGRLVHAIDAKTRKSVWSYRTGGRICSPPAIAYGRLYVGGNDGRVYCFEPCKPDYKPPEPQAPPAEPAEPLKPMAAKLEGKPGAAGSGPGKPAGGTDWPMYGGCAARCGLEVKVNLPLEPAWKFATGGRVRSSPVISGGLVYFGSDSGRFFAVDLKTGEEKWKVETGSPLRSAPAVAGGIVVCGAEDGMVRAFDAAAGGKPKWTFRTGGPVLASPAIVTGRVVFGSGDHHCYCLRLSDGAELWRFKTSHEVQAPPAVSGGRVYVGDWLWKLRALDLGTGKPLADFSLSGVRDLGRPQGMAVYRGVLALTCGEDEGRGWGYVLDAANGKRLASTGLGPTFGAPVFSGRLAFLPAAWKSLAVMDLEAGETVSSRVQCRDPLLQSPLVAGNLMIVAAKTGTLKALSITDGKEPAKTLWEWKNPAGARFATAPAAAGGHVVVGSDDGHVYAFRSGGK